MKAQVIKKEQHTGTSMEDYGIIAIDWDNKEKAGKQICDALKVAEHNAKKHGFLSLEEVEKRLGR
jgi:hypothetical protein